MIMMTKMSTPSTNKFESVVQNDPTLKMFLRDSKIDGDKMEHQLDIKFAALRIALNRWIDKL